MFFGGADAIISGITVYPRQDDDEGVFSQWELYLSLDGTTFESTAIASSAASLGDWADSFALKTTRFSATTARGVRVKALAEAGVLSL